MKNTIYILGALFLLCLIGCNNGSKNKDECENKDKELEIKRQQREVEWHQLEYDALCFVGKKRWENVEAYMFYISNEENKKDLNEELEQDGWLGVQGLSFAYERINDSLYVRLYEKSLNTPQVLWDDINLEYLYMKLRVSNVYVGTLKDFKQELKSENGFVKYYKKALKLGLFGNWEQFVMFMFEPNCDYCECEREHVDDDDW